MATLFVCWADVDKWEAEEDPDKKQEKDHPVRWQWVHNLLKSDQVQKNNFTNLISFRNDININDY